jgi:hypothetical protein
MMRYKFPLALFLSLSSLGATAYAQRPPVGVEPTDNAAWFACNSDSDCVFAVDHCAYRSVNQKYRSDFEAYTGLRDAAIGPTYRCRERMEEQRSTQRPVCRNKHCTFLPRAALEQSD